MNINILHSIQCLMCGKSISIKRIDYLVQDTIIHGEVACKCRSYPILNGILLSVDGPILNKIQAFMEMNGWWLRRVEKIPLFIFGLPTTKRLAPLLVIFLGPLIYLPFKWYVWLMMALRIWSTEWSRRILDPGTNEGDLIADQVYSHEKIILDLGCGMGDFELRHDEINKNLSLGIDFDLFVLDATSRYRQQGMNLWWKDLNNEDWWIKEWPFELTVCIDGFHCVDKKEWLVAQLQGKVLLTNLHLVDYFPNHNQFQHALSETNYLKLFNQGKLTRIKTLEKKVMHVLLNQPKIG